MASVRVPFPLFALLVEQATGVVFFSHPQFLILPLFTSDDEINLFRTRHLPTCKTLQIATPVLLHSFLQGPEGEWNSHESFRVIFDPIAMAVDTDTISVDRAELISACAPAQFSAALPLPHHSG